MGKTTYTRTRYWMDGRVVSDVGDESEGPVSVRVDTGASPAKERDALVLTRPAVRLSLWKGMWVVSEEAK